jgi:hypothetical protein
VQPVAFREKSKTEGDKTMAAEDQSTVASDINSDTPRFDQLPNRIIVIGLMLVLAVVVGGTVALAALGKDIPSELTSIAMPIITGVAGFYTGQSISQKNK